MEDFKLSEQDGFKVVYIPIKTSIREFSWEAFETEYHFLLEELKTSLSDEANNEFYPGYYYIKKIDGLEYFILVSNDYVGMSINSKLPDGSEEKSALYSVETGLLTLRWNKNNKIQSTGPSRRYTSDGRDYGEGLTFTKEELDGFVERFINESYKCDNIEKVMDINTFRDVILDKTGRVQS